MRRLSTTLPTVEVVVSSRGASATTSTDSVTLPTERTKLIWAVCATSSVMPLRTACLKFASAGFRLVFADREGHGGVLAALVGDGDDTAVGLHVGDGDFGARQDGAAGVGYSANKETRGRLRGGLRSGKHHPEAQNHSGQKHSHNQVRL